VKSKLILASNRILGICMLLTIVFAIGCSTPTILSNSPPNAKGKADGQMIEFIKGSYQWNQSFADSPTPDSLVKDTTVYIIKPSTILTLNYEGNKPDSVSVTLWENSDQVIRPQGNTFILPSEPGTYVLTVSGEWSGNNRATNAAAIEVKDPL